MFVRNPYNYDADEVSEETGLKCEDESLAVQSEKDEADINTIVRRFGLTGQLPENVRMPQYGDFTGITDYQTALNTVIAADEAFMTMPAEIRQRFNHDPQEFVEFCLDANNLEEARKLGLVPAAEVKTAPAAEGAPASAAGGQPVANSTQ